MPSDTGLAKSRAVGVAAFSRDEGSSAMISRTSAVSATAFDFDASEAAASADAQQALFREVCRFRPELAAITSPPSKAKRRHPSEYGSSSPSSRNWPRYQPAAAANRGAAHRGVARG